MLQKKRGGGRVTASKKARAAHDAQGGSQAPLEPYPVRRRVDDPAPAASSRYTPPKAKFRVRPRWHRIAGWIGVALGVLVVVLNDGMYVTAVHLLPLGHSELYLLLGLLVAGSSSWFLGVFDHGTTIYD